VEPRGDPRLEAAIRAVGAWRGRDIGITPVSLGGADRHYMIEAGDELFVLRLEYGSVPDARTRPSTEIEVSRAAAAAGVAPGVIEHLPQFGCLITRFAPGRRLGASEVDDATLASIVGSLRALHACPQPLARRSIFRDAEELRHAAIACRMHLPRAERAATEAMRRIEAAITVDPAPVVTCHGDLTRASLCIDGDHVWIVDYRWAGAGDAFEDLGSLSEHLALSDVRTDALVRLYFGSFDAGRRARLDLMRLAARYLAAMRTLVRRAAAGARDGGDVDGLLSSVIEDAATERLAHSFRFVAGR
jgi:thiamine kinase-like enzyme